MYVLIKFFNLRMPAQVESESCDVVVTETHCGLQNFMYIIRMQCVCRFTIKRQRLCQTHEYRVKGIEEMGNIGQLNEVMIAIAYH